MRDRTIGLVLPAIKAGVCTGLAVMLLGLGLGTLPAGAATVTGVKVQDRPDRVEISATVDGGVHAWCTQSKAGQWITMDFEAGYGTKPVRRVIRSATVYAVKGGWFQTRPQRSRISVTTSARVPYDFNRVDGKTVQLVVWKSRAAKDAAQVSEAQTPPAAQKPLQAPKPCVTPLACVTAPKPGIAAPKPCAATASPAAAPVAAVKPVQPRVAPGTPIVAATPAVAIKVAGAHEVLDARSLKPGQPIPPAATITGAKVASVRQVSARSGSGWEMMAKRPAKAGSAPAAAAAPAPARARGLVSLNFVGTDINDVLKALAEQGGVNIVTATDVKGEVTVALHDVDFTEALDAITKLSGFRWLRQGNTCFVATTKSLGQFTNPESNTAAAAVETVPFSRIKAVELQKLIKAEYPEVTSSIVGDPEHARDLVLQGPAESVNGARSLVERVMSSVTKAGAGQQFEIYHVRYASPTSLAMALANLAPDVLVNPGVVSDTVGQQTEVEGEAGGKGSSGGSGSSGSSGSGAGAGTGVSGNSSGSSGSGSSTGGTTAGSSGGSSSGGKGDNKYGVKYIGNLRTLILSGRAEDVAKAKEILAKLDVPVPQVMIEAKLVDISVSDEKKQGFTYDQSMNGFNIGLSGRKDDTTTTKQYDLFLKSSLQALLTNGNARVLAHPKISSLEGEPAKIFIGDRIRYISRIGSSSGGDVTVETDEVEAGIALNCLAQVNSEDGRITLSIHPEVSTPTFVTNQAAGVTLPQIRTRMADSTIRVKDGETIVIAGLLNQTEEDTLKKIPYLSNLPFFGELFKSRERTKDNRELVIFITCSIVKES